MERDKSGDATTFPRFGFEARKINAELEAYLQTEAFFRGGESRRRVILVQPVGFGSVFWVAFPIQILLLLAPFSFHCVCVFFKNLCLINVCKNSSVFVAQINLVVVVVICVTWRCGSMQPQPVPS